MVQTARNGRRLRPDSFLRSGIKYGPDGEEWKTAEALAAHIRREYLANIIDRLEC